MVNTKALNQVKLLDKFYDTMKKNENMVAYGEKDVVRCIHMQAVDTMLISDHLFQTKDFKKRRVYNDIVDEVKKYGGNTIVFSSLHSSGEKLKSISGIAAILRFEVMELEEEEEEHQENLNDPEQDPETLSIDISKLKIVEEDDDHESEEEEEVEEEDEENNQ